MHMFFPYVICIICAVLFEMKPGKLFEFKSVLISAVIAFAGLWGVWYLFYQVFNITLP